MSNSIRTTLRGALSDCIKEMTIAAGYNFNYIRVHDPAMNMEKMREYPEVNILYGREERLNSRLIGNDPLLDILLPVQFDVFLHSTNDTSLAQDKTIADFQKYFGLNYYIKPSSGDRTVFNCLWRADLPWGTEAEKPNCGVSVEFDVYYSIRLNNPYVMV